MLNLSLRLNRSNTTLADHHGDIWVQVTEAALQQPDIMTGPTSEIAAKVSIALQLTAEPKFPLTRLLTIWRNKTWRELTATWCNTTLGRETFRISTWDWMISCRIDDVRPNPPDFHRHHD